MTITVFPRALPALDAAIAVRASPLIEEHLARHPYLVGASFSSADAYVGQLELPSHVVVRRCATVRAVTAEALAPNLAVT